MPSYDTEYCNQEIETSDYLDMISIKILEKRRIIREIIRHIENNCRIEEIDAPDFTMVYRERWIKVELAEHEISILDQCINGLEKLMPPGGGHITNIKYMFIGNK